MRPGGVNNFQNMAGCRGGNSRAKIRVFKMGYRGEIKMVHKAFITLGLCKNIN